MTVLCKHFNAQSGCKKSREQCSHKHELYCTNEICVNANRHQTHSLEQCGQKGGGAHEAFIEEKRKVSMAEKEKKKAAKIDEAKNALCEQLYPLVQKVLEGSNGEVDKLLKKPLTAGKIVGMFHAGCSPEDLTEMVSDETKLVEGMGDAFEVILAAETV
jgi:hypothetical protein